uniref:Ferritin n=1 Tax=Cherax quadricarinatus TaxID=27406 RepID=A0A2I7ZGE4_CHEQU|nr:ferritin-like [Cherax quadricarinatus]AUS91514.1 ferritin [Cherax quadricarinatus]
MASSVRHNYHEDNEAALNKYINLELHASYVFLALSYHFDRDDVALPGLSKLFRGYSDFELVNAHKLMKYQNQRGGRVVLHDVFPPSKQEWDKGLEGIQTALDLKKELNEALLNLHGKVSETNDPHVLHFLDDNFINEHVETIKKLGDMVTQLQRAGDGHLGLHIFDKDLL